jgi:hypothetical protein
MAGPKLVDPNATGCNPLFWPFSSVGCICSAGFVAKGNATGYLKLLTAGHCTNPGNQNLGLGDDVASGGYNVGNVAGQTSGSDCNIIHTNNYCVGSQEYDVAKISCGTLCDGVQNCVWKVAGDHCYAHTGVKGSCCMHVGDPVLLMSAYEDPGTVDISAVNNMFDNGCLPCAAQHGFQVDYYLDHGASGSPAYDTTKAWGLAVIHASSGCGPGSQFGCTNYDYLNNGTSNESAQAALDVAVCTNSDCSGPQ